MKATIHYEVNGYEDSFVIEADTIDELRVLAQTETERRGAVNCWSEVQE
jgi:hypothetical protein